MHPYLTDLIFVVVTIAGFVILFNVTNRLFGRRDNKTQREQDVERQQQKDEPMKRSP